MQATRAIYERMVALFAADTNFLNSPDPDDMAIYWATADFAPRSNLTAADMTNSGVSLDSNKQKVNTGGPFRYTDVNNGDQITQQSPAFGPFQILTAGFTAPVRVFGYYLLGQLQTTMYAYQKFDRPIAFDADNQVFFINTVIFRFPVGIIR